MGAAGSKSAGVHDPRCRERGSSARQRITLSHARNAAPTAINQAKRNGLLNTLKMRSAREVTNKSTTVIKISMGGIILSVLR
jgi:hypothetical protein